MPAAGAPPPSVEISGIRPETDHGRFANKREIGDGLIVSADVFREGHDSTSGAAAAPCLVRTGLARKRDGACRQRSLASEISFEVLGRHEYRIVAFPDSFQSWRHGIEKKLEAGVEITSDLLEGRADGFQRDLPVRRRRRSSQSALDFAEGLDDPAQAHVLLSESLLHRMLDRAAERDFAAISPIQEVFVDRDPGAVFDLVRGVPPLNRNRRATRKERSTL